MEEILYAFSGRTPSSFLFELIDIASNAVDSIEALTVHNGQGNYSDDALRIQQDKVLCQPFYDNKKHEMRVSESTIIIRVE